MEYEGMNWLAPAIGIVGAWFRLEFVVKIINRKLEIVAAQIEQNRDMKELIALMRWQIKERTGREAPPFVSGD